MRASQHEPDPCPGQGCVADHVLKDIEARVEAGKARYGTKLQMFNGRDAMWDAYQEAIDLVMYLRQAILEKEEMARGGAKHIPSFLYERWMANTLEITCEACGARLGNYFPIDPIEEQWLRVTANCPTCGKVNTARAEFSGSHRDVWHE